MPAPKEHVITNLTDFTRHVVESLEETRNKYGDEPAVTNWYRGCGKSSYELNPSLYRHKKITDSDKLLELERDMMKWFNSDSVFHQAAIAHIDKDFEQLFFMQHYGVPTRLLDWTNNPYIALFFALTRAHRDKVTGDYNEDAAVWVLNPYAWNAKALSHITWQGGPLDIEEAKNKGYGPRKGSDIHDSTEMLELPVAMLGVANTTRMFAQKGVFAIFGTNTNPMEKIYRSKKFPIDSLKKLVIPRDRIGELLNLTLAIGYTDSVAYPDLEGLALDIKRWFKF